MKETQKIYLFTEAEYEVFFKQYFRLALLVSVRITDDLTASEDIVQDVFLWIWKNIDSIRPGETLKSLLLTSVKNKSLNYIRDKKDTRAIDEAISLKSDEKLYSEEDERIIKILEQIDSLPLRCREIFMMVVFNEKKYKEAADHFGVSINTIKTQMGIAYKHLREKFDVKSSLLHLFLKK